MTTFARANGARSGTPTPSTPTGLPGLCTAAPRDELANDRLAYAEASRAIRQEPGMFLYAGVVRIGRLWAPMPHRIADDEGPPVGGSATPWADGTWPNSRWPPLGWQ